MRNKSNAFPQSIALPRNGRQTKWDDDDEKRPGKIELVTIPK